jgi:hypothetical protein
MEEVVQHNYEAVACTLHTALLSIGRNLLEDNLENVEKLKGCL